MYRVVGWSERYETSESRKRRRLDWVAVPNQWDSRAYLAIVKLPDGAAILGAWMLILEVASRTPERGLLAEDGIALTAEDIAAKVRIPVKVISRALDVLSSPLIGWLESAATPADHAATPADDAATPADHAGVPVLPNSTIPYRTEQNKECRGMPARRHAAAPAYPPEYETWWTTYRVLGSVGGKLPALRAWERLSEEDRAALLERTRAYIARRAAASARGLHIPFAPHGSTFLHQRRWDDAFAADPTAAGEGRRTQ